VPTIQPAGGAGFPSLVDSYNATTLGLLDSFFALRIVFTGGVFVGGN
jgi:hypothetical protein